METRSGDTTGLAPRRDVAASPPHILVTTPESLYLMLTAERSRETLRGVRTVIVDEIHAVARDKRGSHLALSLERLEALCDTRPVRDRSLRDPASDRDRRATAGRRRKDRRAADGSPR